MQILYQEPVEIGYHDVGCMWCSRFNAEASDLCSFTSPPVSWVLDSMRSYVTKPKFLTDHLKK